MLRVAATTTTATANANAECSGLGIVDTTRHSIFELIITTLATWYRCIRHRQKRHNQWYYNASTSTVESAVVHSRLEHLGSDDCDSSGPTTGDQRLEHDGRRDIAVRPLSISDSELWSGRRRDGSARRTSERIGGAVGSTTLECSIGLVGDRCDADQRRITTVVASSIVLLDQARHELSLGVSRLH